MKTFAYWMMFNDFANGEWLSLDDAIPTLCFHFKTWQRSRRQNPNRHTQIQRCLQGSFQFPLQ